MSAISNFWTVDVGVVGNTFAIELTFVERIFTLDPTRFLELQGRGVVSAAGFEDTWGTWSFTGDTTGSGTFTWSGGTAVPLPAPIWILVTGLGLIGIKRRLG